jgi:hypothetical protein
MDGIGLLIIFALWLALIWFLEPMWADEGSKTESRAASKIRNESPPFTRRRPLPEGRNVIHNETVAETRRDSGRRIGIRDGKRQCYD